MNKNYLKKLLNFNLIHLISLITIFIFLIDLKKIQPDLQFNFSYEYGNIAESLIRTGEYANPFKYITGLTNWMPPFFVFFMAGIFSLFGIKSLISCIILLLIKLISYISCYFITLNLVFKNNFKRKSATIVFFFITLISFYLYRRALINNLHDTFLLSFVITIIFLVNINLSKFTISKFDYKILIFLGLLPLIHPILCIVYILMILIFRRNLNVKNKQEREILKKYNQGILLIFITIALWISSNLLINNKISLFKSNLWFDFYQANVLDEDGLITSSTFHKYHPMVNRNALNLYYKLGENNYMEMYKNNSIKYLIKNHDKYFFKVLNRIKSAFIYLNNSFDFLFLNSIDNKYIPELSEAKLIHYNDLEKRYAWTSLKEKKPAIIEKISNIEASKRDLILNLWEYKKERLEHQDRKNFSTFRSYWFALVPTLSIIYLFFTGFRKTIEFQVGVVIYLLYLAPYILITHYSRYQLPLMFLQTFFITSALITLKNQLSIIINKVKR